MQIQEKNPTEALVTLVMATDPKAVKVTWTQTCLSDTCGCMSHDPGYYEITGRVPAGVVIRSARGDPSGWTASSLGAEDKTPAVGFGVAKQFSEFGLSISRE